MVYSLPASLSCAAAVNCLIDLSTFIVLLHVRHFLCHLVSASRPISSLLFDSLRLLLNTIEILALLSFYKNEVSGQRSTFNLKAHNPSLRVITSVHHVGSVRLFISPLPLSVQLIHYLERSNTTVTQPSSSIAIQLASTGGGLYAQYYRPFYPRTRDQCRQNGAFRIKP